MAIIVCVCGGRTASPEVAKLVIDTLDQTQPDILVHGGAAGVDSVADQWALDNNVSTMVFKADWRQYGKAAGPIRNKEMVLWLRSCLDLPMHHEVSVIAFPGGTGTTNMTIQARHHNLPVIRKVL